MLDFLIDNICVTFDGRVFQQTVSIPVGTDCAPLLADLFLYSYEADFIRKLLRKKEKKLAICFNFVFRCSLNFSKFDDFVEAPEIIPSCRLGSCCLVSCCLVFSFLCCVSCTIICMFAHLVFVSFL